MTTTFLDYILNPIYLTIYFATNDDFITKGKRNYVYFFINFFIALIITLLGFIFNEFIIIFYFGLEKETHQEISRRASSINETEIRISTDFVKRSSVKNNSARNYILTVC